MKRKLSSLTALILVIILSFTSISFAESTLPLDQKKEIIKMIFFNAKTYAKEDIDTAELLAEALMKLAGEDDKNFEKAMSALLQSIDEYGDYIPKDDSDIWQSELTGQSGGIGATVNTKNGRVVVENVLPGSPAEKANVKPGYVFLKADDTDLEGMSINQALSYVRGEIGTKVDILFEVSEGETVLLTIIRDKIDIVSVYSDILGENKDIGYINISNFSNETGNELSRFLKEFKEQGINKLILDLRDNGGGTTQGAIEVADAFLKKDDVIFSIEPRNPEEKATYTAGGQEFSGEMVLLVNEYSASSSEIVAGALKDNNRATIIGNRTFGKGTVQQLYPLYIYGGMFKFTTAHYQSPNGTAINKKGVAPHLTVDNKKHKIPEEEMPAFTFEREVSQGDFGKDVFEIKKGLKILRYKMNEDESYDYEMVNAIKDFQYRSGLEPTGMCDVNTMQSLYNLLNELEIYEDTQLETAIKFFESGL